MDRPWQARFLAALSEAPNVSEACRRAGIARCHAYVVRKEDPKFAELWDEAIETAVDDLAGDAWLRAKGPDADTRLTIFLLQAHRREVYGPKLEQQLSGGQTIEVRYADAHPAETAPGTTAGIDGVETLQRALDGPAVGEDDLRP